ncbi:flagellar motor protein MotB [Rubellimicrobium aerolatum]|uniref:Flagellar motor protein MotB n=1 Tax=Rubellimicrobium aerolatum TaxID=490979 RepID=A0ABW0S9W2_9RHOB|nr:flagellar motor protein MotB [Rubellimicrobium aerolatum]MBP1805093.1 chemotaxis protein MotB [Rubellimicrobium aerolatum]
MSKGAGLAPIIIKRKKAGGGDGHHGGAWKVAYADFVTAMMAFFLLMWLLNATTEQQRKGLADYFAPDIPLSRVSGGSDGMFGGDSPTSSDAARTEGKTAPGLVGAAGFPGQGESESEAADRAAEVAALVKIEDALLGRGGESFISEEALQHVVTRLTDEGLVVEIFATPGAPIFDAFDEPLPATFEIVGTVARMAGLVTNPVAVAAHVPAAPALLAPSPAWDSSLARADRTRRMLGDHGLPAERIARVTGHGDRSPAVGDPTAPRNDRLEITLLRRGREGGLR